MAALRFDRNESGSALVVSLVTGVFIAGFTYAFVLVSQGEIAGANAASRRTKALQAAEAGIGESFDRLNRGVSASIRVPRRRSTVGSTTRATSIATADATRPP